MVWASFAPQGAASIVAGARITSAIKLTLPNDQGGSSSEPQPPMIAPMVPGKAMIRPMADAVPTARRIG
jgi:hypothetical protein